MVTETKPKEKTITEEPNFIDPEKLTAEQLTDPDYRLKQIMKGVGANPAVCSKCHHCR